MKIVHVQSYFQPHLGYQEYYLCKYMAKMGHEVHMITSDRFMPFKGLHDENRIVGSGVFEHDEFTIHRLPLYFECRNRVILKDFVKRLKYLKPDLIFLHGSTNFLNILVFITKSLRKCKMIIDEHHMSIVANNSNLAHVYYKIWALIYRKITSKSLVKLVGVAPDCCSLLSNKLNIPAKNINYIPLGADTEIFRSCSKIRSRFRLSLGYNNKDVVVVYTGKINYEKDPFIILRAFIGEKKYNNIKFLFVGNISPKYLKDYEVLIKSQNIKIISSVSSKKLSGIYNASDIACWPKHASLSSIEAASCGLPIIINEIVSERVVNGNGFAVNEEDLVDIKNKIMSLVGDANLRKKMGSTGRNFVKKSLCYEKISKDFLKLHQ